MAIGGKREGAGRKSGWRSPTKMIRLPAQYEQQIIDYARLLDSDSESGAGGLRLVLQQEIDGLLMSLPPRDRKAAGKLFNKLLARLDGVELAGNGKDPTRVQKLL